jgi:hypothetical protein
LGSTGTTTYIQHHLNQIHSDKLQVSHWEFTALILQWWSSETIIKDFEKLPLIATLLHTMQNQAQAPREGQGAATGAASITVEKHKANSLSQYGTFEDKPSQNIARWLEKADNYRTSHMIESLEMGSIIIHCIRGEPARKVRRMLDVPGATYINPDYTLTPHDGRWR